MNLFHSVTCSKNNGKTKNAKFKVLLWKADILQALKKQLHPQHSMATNCTWVLIWAQHPCWGKCSGMNPDMFMFLISIAYIFIYLTDILCHTQEYFTTTTTASSMMEGNPGQTTGCWMTFQLTAVEGCSMMSHLYAYTYFLTLDDHTS